MGLKEAKPAFEQVYDQAAYDQKLARLGNYFYSRTGNFDIAEDLAAQAMSKVYKGWDRFDPSRGIPIEHWEWTIAHNVAANYHRDNKHETSLQRMPWLPDTSNPQEETEQRWLAQKVREAVIKLGEPQSTVIRGLHFEGKKDKELAALLNKSPGAIRVIATRGREKLKGMTELREILDDFLK